MFEFEAKKGRSLVGRSRFRALRIADRSGDARAASDPFRGDDEKLTDVAEFSDMPSPVKVSSNGYAYDGPPYNAGSCGHPRQVGDQGRRSLSSATHRSIRRNTQRASQRLSAGHSQGGPDFALVAWALHMELRNGDRNAVSKPLALRGGATMALEVVAFRRDGFDGEINLAMTDLPERGHGDGLENTGRTIARPDAGDSQSECAPCLGNAAFVPAAQIDGQEVTHPCRLASMAWPILDAWSEIPFPRLLADVPVSVSGFEFAPLSIAPPIDVIQAVTAGGKLTIPLFHTHAASFLLRRCN